MDTKRYALAEVKAVNGDSPNGEFEAVLSMPTLDRDDEVIDVRAFDPLPPSIPMHAFHDFGLPIGRAVPRYEGDRLVARGFFASTAEAQNIRALVTEGVIGHTSVGFMAPTREERDGKTHITKAELLEASFVSVPSNREAMVLAAKAVDTDVLLPLLKAINEKLDRLLPTDPETQAAAPAAASPPAEVFAARLAAMNAELLLLN